MLAGSYLISLDKLAGGDINERKQCGNSVKQSPGNRQRQRVGFSVGVLHRPTFLTVSYGKNFLDQELLFALPRGISIAGFNCGWRNLEATSLMGRACRLSKVRCRSTKEKGPEKGLFLYRFSAERKTNFRYFFFAAVFFAGAFFFAIEAGFFAATFFAAGFAAAFFAGAFFAAVAIETS